MFSFLCSHSNAFANLQLHHEQKKVESLKYDIRDYYEYCLLLLRAILKLKLSLFLSKAFMQS